jgi:hypothetical protein
MSAMDGALAARRWLAVAGLALILPACAEPEMPHLVPEAGRRVQFAGAKSAPTLENFWIKCLVGARRTIVHGSVDCGELYDRPRGPQSREAALRCSYGAWLARKPFFVRAAYGSHFPEGYLLVGHADGSLTYFDCGWDAPVTFAPDFRCSEADVVFFAWAPACDATEAPSPFGQSPRRELRRIDSRRW